MVNPIYHAQMAQTWRNLAVHTGQPEIAFNLCELALIHDRQIEAAEERKHRHRPDMPQLRLVQ